MYYLLSLLMILPCIAGWAANLTIRLIHDLKPVPDSFHEERDWEGFLEKIYHQVKYPDAYTAVTPKFDFEQGEQSNLKFEVQVKDRSESTCILFMKTVASFSVHVPYEENQITELVACVPDQASMTYLDIKSSTNPADTMRVPIFLNKDPVNVS